ncbi:EamA family transporter [Aliarcobacter cryaerophilus]|uniref:EamA family transporter n=1 Tax=Aliarcobacter cryaerophilus TaxID=28198 RepID=UPI0021B1EE48|nr:EamA family transporter [Aliarcobacter cryaerophilus]MCT7527179.1 EamA family transporter [Aliarcobacter cryaerophilus]
MSFFQIFLTVSCVLAISIGQLLFKKVSININQSDRLFSFEVLGTFSLAIFIYGLATLFWIYILKSIPLNQAYSFMALSFVFVSMGSYWFFNEKITLNIIIGLVLIILGLLFISNN